jgi:serine/threonine protein kinase
MSLALRDAYKAEILHRDFSPGNIIIGPDGGGRLIDWDLSKPLGLASTSSETPRRATRTVRTNILSDVVIESNSLNVGPLGYLAVHVR